MAATIISDNLLDSLIAQINECQKQNGGGIDIPSRDLPGIGNVLGVFFFF
jgi:hypothetical protein